jgi:branched chain amino acid efflux pump
MLRKTVMENRTCPDSSEAWFKDGVLAAWPICFGYIPIGLALGVLGNQAGIPVWAVTMMSILVFAGSAQFICVAMLAAGASVWSIIFTTFVVNLRHFLMSSAVAVHLTGVRRLFLSIFAYGITDESFAVNMTRFREEHWDHRRAITVNQLANMAWITATTVGALVGQFIPRGAFGTDYALTAMFLALLLFQLHNAVYVLTGITALGIATAWYLLIPGDSYIIGASITAATMGYFFKRYRDTRK